MISSLRLLSDSELEVEFEGHLVRIGGEVLSKGFWAESTDTWRRNDGSPLPNELRQVLLRALIDASSSSVTHVEIVMLPEIEASASVPVELRKALYTLASSSHLIFHVQSRLWSNTVWTSSIDIPGRIDAADDLLTFHAAADGWLRADGIALQADERERIRQLMQLAPPRDLTIA